MDNSLAATFDSAVVLSQMCAFTERPIDQAARVVVVNSLRILDLTEVRHDC